MHDRFRNLVYAVALVIMIGWLFHIGRSVIIPVIAGVILAYIIIALTRRLADIPRIGPMLPVALRYAFSVLVIIGIVVAIIILIINNIGQVFVLIPEYQTILLSVIQNFAVRLGIETEPTWETLRNQVFGQINLQSLIGSTVISVSSFIGTMVVVFIYTGFLLAERRLFEHKLTRLSDNPKDTALIAHILNDINSRIGDYLATKTFINLILGLASYLILVWIGIDLPEFWALMIALLNYIPYVGSFLGVVFPVGLALVQFGVTSAALSTLIGLTFAQIVIGAILEPRLMGQTLNLSPFVILVMLTVWTRLWGIPGALLAIPITAILVIILSEFDGTRPFAILLTRSGRIPRRSRIRRTNNVKPRNPAN